MTSTLLASFLAGSWVGLAVAAPIGPMGMLCIQRTLAGGMAAGLGTGLAAATVQVSYGTMTVLGLGPLILAAIGGSAGILSAASGAILLLFAVRTARGARAGAAAPAAAAPSPGLARSFRDALALGFANPMAIALFLAASPVLVRAGHPADAAAAIAGIFAGVIGWYVSLSSAVTIGRSRLSARGLERTRRLSAAILVAFAAYMFAQALRPAG